MFTVRVMTYNIQGHVAARDPRHLEAIAREIDAAAPDVVCLQEVHCRTRRIGVDQAEELSRLTEMRAAFGRSCEIDGGDYGNALLTRGEVATSAVHPLPGSGEPRTVMHSEVRLDGHSLEVLVTHLSPWGRLRRRERLEQIAQLAEVISHPPSFPRIVAGDFNVPPRSREIRELLARTGLRPGDTTREPTHPLTRMRLDYVLHDSRMHVVRSRVVRRGPSDHWPLVVELAVESA